MRILVLRVASEALIGEIQADMIANCSGRNVRCNFGRHEDLFRLTPAGLAQRR